MSITCIYHECHMHVATYMHATCSIHAYNMHVWSNMHGEYCKHACYMHDILTRALFESNLEWLAANTVFKHVQ